MKIRSYLAMSLNGFIAGKNEDLSWLDEYNHLPELADKYLEFTKDVDCYVIGSKTYEKVLTFPDWLYKNRVVVVTTQARTSIHGEEFYKGSMQNLMKQLEQDGVKSVYADGGTVVTQLIQEKLLQELIVTLIPKVLTSGTPLFGPLPPLTMKLVKNVSYPMGLVQLTYKLTGN